MSERLVVEKGPRQRRIEGILYFALPPLIGAICRICLGPGVWQIPTILLAFIVLSLIGNSVAIRLGGELMSPAERWRRSVARIVAQPLPSLLFWVSLFYLLLFLGMLLPTIRTDANPREIPSMLAISLPGSLVAGGICAFYVRSQALAASVPAPPPLQAPWQWLAAALPFRLIGLLGIVGGYFIGRQFSFDISLVVLLAGSWVGLIIETAAKNRFAKSGPVLWHNFSFAAALATGASLRGVYSALFVGLMGQLTPDASTATAHERIIVGSIFATAGFLAGMLSALIPWALTRINTVKAKN